MCCAMLLIERNKKKKNIKEYDVTADTFMPAAKWTWLLLL